jgi:hypothetical protein
MVSKYYVTIKLDVHYQLFLRHQFQCDKDIFEFPPRHKFNTMLEHFLGANATDVSDTDYGDDSFRIAIPQMEYKNAANYRYLSQIKEVIYRQKLKEYYNWIIEDRIRQLMKCPDKMEDGSMIKLDRQQCTLILIDEYGFDNASQDAFDRLYKLITRYNRKEINRRYFQNRKRVIYEG